MNAGRQIPHRVGPLQLDHHVPTEDSLNPDAEVWIESFEFNHVMTRPSPESDNAPSPGHDRHGFVVHEFHLAHELASIQDGNRTWSINDFDVSLQNIKQ